MTSKTLYFRQLTGIFAGLFSLWMLFYVLLFVLGALWPALREAGSRVIDARDFSALTNTMLLILLLFWYISFIVAGWVSMRIAQAKWIALVMVTPHFLFAAYNHLNSMWYLFPAWYNIAQVAAIYPLAYLGGRLVNPLQT
jgi:hypothetical protein